MNSPLPRPSDLQRSASSTTALAAETVSLEAPGTSAVAWGAILAGAAGACALSLILVMLGVGLGLSTASPWAGQGASASAFSISTIAWLAFTQLAAAGMGGYLAGRLRTKWVSVHTDEVYFRDTAHGFLAWAVATLMSAAVLSSTIGSIVSTGAQAGASIGATTTGLLAGEVAGGASARSAPPAAGESLGMGYFVDTLFRKDASVEPSATTPTDNDMGGRTTAEVARIFANDLHMGTLPAQDANYVGQLVAQRTGLSQADAQSRVSDAFARVQARLKDTEAAARDTADKVRKASSYSTLWLFVALLIGAFVASLCATFGGRRRDL